MKTSIALALITASIIGATSGYAAEDKKPPAAKPGQVQPGGMGPGMMGGGVMSGMDPKQQRK